MNQLLTDIRSGIRMLVKYPTLSLVATLTLGLGIGLSTTVFCVVNGGLFKGLPFPEAISVDGLIRVLSALPPGVTELACHPGVGDDLNSMYRGERAKEVIVLCDPRVRETLTAQEIEQISFRDLGPKALASSESA